MTNCPYCDFENIPGADYCEQCNQPLSDLHLTLPATPVERSLLKDRVAILEPKKPITVSPDTPVGKVIELLDSRSIGCVLVVEDEKLVGVFSERDALLRLNTEAAELADQPVSNFMTSSPQTLDTGAKLAFAVQRMDLGSFRHIPIVDDQSRPVGVISVRDILRHLTEQMDTV